MFSVSAREAGSTAGGLRSVSSAIWLTNVILFGIWYWGADCGGAVERALATRQDPDFLFPQMPGDQPWAHDWEPEFVDYLCRRQSRSCWSCSSLPER